MARMARPFGQAFKSDPFATRYRCLIGSGPPIPALGLERAIEACHRNGGFQIWVSRRELVWAVYDQLPAREMPSIGNRPEETSADDRLEEAEIIGRYGKCRTKGDTPFDELVKLSKWRRLVDVPQGVAEKWYWDRVVLVGGSAHRPAPHASLGEDTNLQSAAALVNQLHYLMQSVIEPSRQGLMAAFQRYQVGRGEDVKAVMALSARAAKRLSCADLGRRLLDRVAGERSEMAFIDDSMAPLCSRGLVLSFLEEANFKEGLVAWKNQPRVRGKASVKGTASNSSDGQDWAGKETGEL